MLLRFVCRKHCTRKRIQANACSAIKFSLCGKLHPAREKVFKQHLGFDPLNFSQQFYLLVGWRFPGDLFAQINERKRVPLVLWDQFLLQPGCVV
jgi:hypothetical protein